MNQNTKENKVTEQEQVREESKKKVSFKIEEVTVEQDIVTLQSKIYA